MTVLGLNRVLTNLVPAVAVTQEGQALFSTIGCKGRVDGTKS